MQRIGSAPGLKNIPRGCTDRGELFWNGIKRESLHIPMGKDASSMTSAKADFLRKMPGYKGNTG